MRTLLRPLSRFVKIAWASPYTLFGLSMLFVPLPGRRRLIRYRGTLGVIGPAIARLLRCAPIQGGAVAMTLGHTILAQSHETFLSTWEHEAVHVRQYERWGPFFVPAYLLCSLWLMWRGADPYWDNPFEREARALS